ncbi:MAG TPA: permease prefix domain 1-containing protein, partial [Rhizomicrobium sp.]|nr:permease prefix domain 1-containing protein [Rhizomicrobium sp.]
MRRFSTRSLRAWCLRFTGLFGKRRREQELADEIAAHLEMHVADNLRAGMTEQEARRGALLKLGGVESLKENYRDRSTLPLMEAVLQDTRFAIRQLRKNAGFTVAAI